MFINKLIWRHAVPLLYHDGMVVNSDGVKFDKFLLWLWNFTTFGDRSLNLCVSYINLVYLVSFKSYEEVFCVEKSVEQVWDYSWLNEHIELQR